MNLRLIRWGCRAVLGVGVAASIVGNVLHARDNPISQAISAWPPIALLLTIELISRVPVHGRRLSATRVAACAVVAGIAAWVSYSHMMAVTIEYGETGVSPYLYPLSVDGLVVVVWICLAELAGRIRDAAAPALSVAPPPDEPAGQDVRLDERASQDIDKLVAALKTADPKASQRELARLARVSDTTVRRSLRRMNGKIADLEEAGADAG